MLKKADWVSQLLLVFTCLFPTASLLEATTFSGSKFGWQIHLPNEWKIEVLQDTGGSVSGAPAKAWMIKKDPMTYVIYQIEDSDIRNSMQLEEFKNKSFERISASMQHTARQVSASPFSNIDQIVVGNQVFDTLVWILEAPGRPDLKSMTLVAPMADKAVTINVSCTGADCDTVFRAIDNSHFSNPDGKGVVIPAPPPLPPTALRSTRDPVWDFTIPLGWQRVAVSSPEDKLAIEKGEGNSLSYALMADENHELALMTINDLKGEIFKETMTQFQQIAHENGLLFGSEEEVIMLGKAPFQTLTLSLVDPNTQEPVMVVAHLISMLNDKLAMIMITCMDELSCVEVQEAVEDSSFR